MSDAASNLPIEERDEADLPPVVRQVGWIDERDPDVEDYRRYLLEKYGSGVVFPADEIIAGNRSTD